MLGRVAAGRRVVRDDALHPDPGFAELYAALPEAADLEPWLSECLDAGGPVLYVGVGAGRLAVPLAAEGVELVGVDAHPGMLASLRERAPQLELVEGRIESVDLGRTFALVVAPSHVLCTPARLLGAARHVGVRGRVLFELPNPHWLATAPEGVRVLALRHDQAEIEVPYPTGDTQVAVQPLVWPEEVEEFLRPAGLRLTRLWGSDDEGGLDASPAFYVLATRYHRASEYRTQGRSRRR
jgi:2-polyprenyl-3-methyl-5-hydroxy-6-metoxy-1,4-benzoquinol methylase